jgi:hypothetical protein
MTFDFEHVVGHGLPRDFDIWICRQSHASAARIKDKEDLSRN